MNWCALLNYSIYNIMYDINMHGDEHDNVNTYGVPRSIIVLEIHVLYTCTRNIT